jgi:hypothetical protein
LRDHPRLSQSTPRAACGRTTAAPARPLATGRRRCLCPAGRRRSAKADPTSPMGHRIPAASRLE